MSYRVVGYLDGRRVVIDEGESRARVSGVGGSALGQVLAAPVKPRKVPVRLPRQPLNRVHVQCGFLMRHGLPCARGLHKDRHHRSAWSS